MENPLPDQTTSIVELKELENQAMTNKTYKSKIIPSRYGDPRVITPHGAGCFTMEGKCHYYRVVMNEANTEIAIFDPEGGPFISVGDASDAWVRDALDGRKIVSISVEDLGKEDHFKIRIEVEQ